MESATSHHDTHEDRKAFSERLRRAVSALGLSGSELARRSGVRQPTISRAMRGESTFRMEGARAVCEALGVSAAWLMAGEGPEPAFLGAHAPTSPGFARASKALIGCATPAEDVMSALDAALSQAGVEPCLADYRCALRLLSRCSGQTGRVDRDALNDILALMGAAEPKG